MKLDRLATTFNICYGSTGHACKPSKLTLRKMLSLPFRRQEQAKFAVNQILSCHSSDYKRCVKVVMQMFARQTTRHFELAF